MGGGEGRKYSGLDFRSILLESPLWKLHGGMKDLDGKDQNRRPLEQPRKAALNSGLQRGWHPFPIVSGMQCGQEGDTKPIRCSLSVL